MRGHAIRRSAVLVAILVLVGLGDWTARAAATDPEPIRYGYDASGRLAGVVDPSAGAATYSYDATGNITAIGRPTPGDVVILGFDPLAGSVGSTVTISGDGFDPTPASNAVTFNGTAATVTAASPTQLTVTVPGAASTGTIAVSNSNGSATSTVGFRIQQTPTVSSVSPTIASPGSTLTVGGSNFAAASTMAGVGSGQAVIQSITQTSMALTVPTAGSGRVTVATLDGQATSTQDVYIPPAGYATSSVGYTVRTPLSVTQTVSIASTKIGMLLFEATAGQRISIATSGTTFGSQVVTIRRPSGALIYGPVTLSANWWVEPITLNESGTYSIVIDPTGTTSGSMALTAFSVPADATATATVGGSAVTVTTTVPGQNAAIGFVGTAGQRASFVWTGTTPGNSTTILKPDGSLLRSGNNAGPGTGQAPFFEPLTLPVSGSYTIYIDDVASQTGNHTVRIYDVPADATATATVGGSAVTVTTTVPGQNAAVWFSGTSGQAITVALTAVSIASSDVSIRRPAGTNLIAPTGMNTAGKTLTMILDATGTHTVYIDARVSYVGSIDVRVSITGGGSLPSKFADARPRPNAAVHSSDPILRVRTDAFAAPLALPPENISSDAPGDDEAWTPTAANRSGDWRSHREPTSAQDVQLLLAPEGVTAVSGLVLDLLSRPIAGVTLEMDGVVTRTDGVGRFLLQPVDEGGHELGIDGSTAVGRPGRTYGHFEARVDVLAGTTTVLPYTIWLAPLDTTHSQTFSSPTQQEVVLTTPTIPGLEVHLPAGAVVTDEDGDPVTSAGITAIPIDQPPFPLPNNLEIPVYFTVQPGNAYVSEGGAWIVYPNYTHLVPGTRVDFWQYDPEDPRGWFVYGQGTVTADGSQVVPDPGVRIYSFSGAMFNASGLVPPGVQAWLDSPVADPVDPASGLFVYSRTDLALPGQLPLTVTRSYRQSDTTSRPFGKGSNWNLGIFLWSAQQYQQVDLIMPDGSRVHYLRTSPGTGWTDAVFQSVSKPGPFFNSVIRWNGNGWNLTTTDGTIYVFADNAPLSLIQDRHGNQIWINRLNGNANGVITSITGSNGAAITFGYDASNRITSATDSAGRSVGYQYNAAGYLWKATDPAGGVTEYTYDASGRMTQVKDARGITFLTNTYDASSRIATQTLADGGVYSFAYNVGGGAVTDTTDPRGIVHRIGFNADSRPISDTAAQGLTEQQQTVLTRESGTNLVTSAVDPLGRTTAFTYDANGNPTSVTRLSGTTGATTTQLTYGAFGNPTSVTDPLDHTTTMGYDAQGNLTNVTDDLTHATTFTYDYAGRPTSATDATSKTTTFGYLFGRLISTTDALGRTSRQIVDVAGRVIARANPAGAASRTEYDNLNRPTKVVDPSGGETTFTYDANGNLLTLTDARGGVTTYTYDSMDRVATRTDPLPHAESFTYDANGNLLTATDRRGQVTAFSYDALERPTFVGFDRTGSPGSYAYESSTSYIYDAGNRLTSAVDTAAGTIDLDYDDLDRLIAEASPQGAIEYAYDDADRRTSATLAGQSAVSYAWDATDRLTSITQGGTTIAFGYDNAGRRLSATLPNGVDAAYAYDDAGQLTAIGYAIGATSLGTLAYTYDQAAHRASVAGTLARVSLPAAVGSATYNAANQLTAWGGASLAYDLDGNLIDDGTNSFSWNARNELTAIDAGATSVAAYAYDAFGRRVNKTLASTTTGFAYDGANFVEEQDGAGDPTAGLLVGGVDQALGRTEGSDTSALLVDALGSTLALVDEAGDIATSYTYEPFGATTVTGTASTNAAQFTGRENDGPLYYYRARFYNAAFGRFISEDPLGYAAGDPNLYAYVGNDPINATDPGGTCGPACLLAAGCAIGAVMAAATYLGPGHEFLGQRKSTIGGLLGSAALGCGAGLGAAWVWASGGAAAVATATSTAPIIINAAKGRAGEIAAGIVKNTERIASSTGTAAFRVPDALDKVGRVLTEVKNVGNLGLTRQIQDSLAYAEQEGYTFRLIVDNSTELSPRLRDALDAARLAGLTVDVVRMALR
jgi:RHS repeat-associated protein